ncbi:hypothetical protein MEO93_30055 [Dolichospermum sp. ST_sed3]|nr:hypothetical protein [Dolichospermum sp. ST_sed3]
MNKLFPLLVFSSFVLTSFAQESMEKVMEKRAREMHRVIGLTDKDQWKKFVQENYTQALINKPMQARIQTSEDGYTSASSAETKAVDILEAKASMFQQLHNDFGNSKIISLNPMGEKMDMVLRNNMGMTGTFTLKFDKASPYKIDGLGVEVGEVNR